MRLLVIGGVPAFVTLHQALSESSNVRVVALVESNPEAEGSQYARSNQIPVFQERSQVTLDVDAVVDLTETRQLLEAVIDATQDAISVVDENGNGILINRAYTRLTGLAPLDVIGKPATVDIAEGESMHLQVLRTGQPVRGVQMKVGPARREVIVNVAPMRVGGALKGSVGILHDVSEMKKISDELDHAKQLIRKLEAKYSFDDIIGSSPEMQMALDMARRAAETRATVLLRGESGTGKELFAHAIHNLSDRKYNHFIRVNCAALSESLLESELFGYEEGAFTGARRGGKKGLFEEANGGTILLDEIGELPLNTQAKILRVLQEREIVRVGQAKAIPVDVRIIAATNVNLEKAMANHQFREDLYYRLNVIPIVIPPLRYRTDDIEAIAGRLIRKFNQEFGRSVTRIAPVALEYLKSYHWPGNIRELENVIGRAIMNMKFIDSVIERYHLPMLEQLKGAESLNGVELSNDAEQTVGVQQINSEAIASKSKLQIPGNGQPFALSLQEVTDQAEREYIQAVLATTNGNKTEAAKVLGIAVRSLYYKMEKLCLENFR